METEQEKFYRTANFATAPIRALDYIWQALGMLVLGGIVFMVFIYNSVAWVVDAGAYSRTARLAQVDGMTVSAITGLAGVDLAHRETHREVGIPYADFEETDMAYRRYEIPHENPFRVDDPRYYTSHWGMSATQFCERIGGALDTGSVSWLERDTNWWLRKAYRMEKDLITGESNVAALRYTLTAVSLGVVPEDRSGFSAVTRPPAEPNQSYCAPDRMRDYGHPTQSERLWWKISSRITLADAPDIVYSMTVDPPAINDGFAPTIQGFCLRSANCAPSDLRPYVTLYADLFAEDPPLSPQQMDAEKALLATSDPDFWVREAHENRIFGHDEEIRSYAVRQQVDLAAQLAAQPPTQER